MQDLSLHLLDLVQNSIAAGATQIVINVEEDEEKDWLSIAIEDNGRGMDNETIKEQQIPLYYSNNPKGRTRLATI